jgi:hypothetical protein
VKRTWAQHRARLFAEATPDGATAPRVGGERTLVGRDFARVRPVPRRGAARRWLLPALVGTVFAALLLASLRTAILRARYELAAAMTLEATLLERHRAVAVELRELRDPARLHRLARELGLARPEAVIDLGNAKVRP